MDKLYITVKEQFPQFVPADYPAFVAFVQEYYKWLTPYLGDKLENTVDVDKTAQQFVQYFKQQLDVYGIYSDAAPFDIKYIKTIKDVYTSKGSEQALVFLLKTVYNADDNIKIVYPRDRILRASDGVWYQERFITVSRTFGQLPQNVTSLFLEYQGGEERIDIIRYEQVNETLIRFYFKTNNTISINPNQPVKAIHNNIIVYKGSVVASPNSLTVEIGGSDWQVGQVIIFPGTIKDTIARVSEIGDSGEIKRLEILEYGYDHVRSSSIVVSPYPIRPLVATYDYNYDDDTKTHTLLINDFVDQLSEAIEGTSSNTSLDSYFLERYDSEIYAARVVIKILSNKPSGSDALFDDSSITLEQWLQSRARIRYNFDDLTSTKGKWINSRGLISDSYIRLQDNYYYQQFSYDIESNIPRSKYQSMLDAIHLSGNKYFSTYLASQTLNINIDITSEIPFKWINVSDVSTILDNLYKHQTKPFEDETSTPDEATNNFVKLLSQDVEAIDTINSILIDKQLLDENTASDSISKFYSKTLNDSVIPTQVDVMTSYEIEDYFSEDYDVYAEPLSLESTLS